MKIEQMIEMVDYAMSNLLVASDDILELFEMDRGEISDALDILREGEQPVKVVEDDFSGYQCIGCDHVSAVAEYCPACSVPRVFTKIVSRKSTYTTHRRLVPQTVDSVPVFEEIDDE